MKILKEISTHKAVHENGVINIYQKGFEAKDIDEFGEDFHKSFSEMFKDELLWTIPKENEDDLFAIFERLEEDNKAGLDELNEEMKELIK